MWPVSFSDKEGLSACWEGAVVEGAPRQAPQPSTCSAATWQEATRREDSHRG